MNTIRFLLALSSISFAVFISLICFGIVSQSAFLVSAVAWLLLLTVKAYTPRRDTWAPRSSRLALKNRFALQLAA